MKKNRSGKAAIFTSDEIRKIRKSFNQFHRCIFEIALFTGERMGAIIQLKVEDVYAEPASRIPHNEIKRFAYLGLDHRGFSTHSTRRWFISNLVEKGIDLKTIQAITGHANINVLMGYAEASEERIKGALSTLSILSARDASGL